MVGDRNYSHLHLRVGNLGNFLGWDIHGLGFMLGVVLRRILDGVEREILGGDRLPYRVGYSRAENGSDSLMENTGLDMAMIMIIVLICV